MKYSSLTAVVEMIHPVILNDFPRHQGKIKSADFLSGGIMPGKRKRSITNLF